MSTQRGLRVLCIGSALLEGSAPPPCWPWLLSLLPGQKIWGQTALPLNKACASIQLPNPRTLQIKNSSQVSILTKSSFPNVFMLTTNCPIFFNVAAVTLTWHIWLRLHALKIWNQKVLVPTATTGSNYPGSGNF